MGAEQGTQGLGDSQGEEAVRPGPLSLQVVVKPLVGLLLLTRGTVPVATGMRAAVWLATALARRKAVALGPAVARLESAEGLARRRGQRGRALQGLGRQGREESAAGRHGRSPCRRVLRRS